MDRRIVLGSSFIVTTGHSRSKNGVASLAYDPVVHAAAPSTKHHGKKS